MSVSSILGPGGAISKQWPEFESRPEQLDMAEAVQRAFAGDRHLMVEAGTGVGKSFAYLVPAIQSVLADEKRRVVISTHTRISDYAGLYQKDPLITLGLSLCLLSLGGIPPMLGFFGKIYLFFAGWANHEYLLVVVGLVTSVVSIYYYISVIKMMVVKEPQEASDVVKAYPEVNWSLMGMQPLRVALIGCVAITAVGGILSNPLFQWANTAVAGTPLLQQAIALSSLKGVG